MGINALSLVVGVLAAGATLLALVAVLHCVDRYTDRFRGK